VNPPNNIQSFLKEKYKIGFPIQFSEEVSKNYREIEKGVSKVSKT
jgi:hypothetical protein